MLTMRVINLRVVCVCPKSITAKLWFFLWQRRLINTKHFLLRYRGCYSTDSLVSANSKAILRWIYTVSVFRPFSSAFFTFLLLEKVCAFSSAFWLVHIRTNQTVTHWAKVFQKKFFVKGTALFWNIALIVHTQNFCLYTTVYLVRIRTYKNADEKAHTFSKRSKNVKKRTKTDEKRILIKFTFISTVLHVNWELRKVKIYKYKI